MARTHTRAAAALLLLAGCLAHRGVAPAPGHPLAPAGVVALALTPVSEPGSLAALQGRTVSVRDFGAAGDGVADDGAAINAAIEAAAVGGGVVFFPAGTYSVGSSVRSPVAGFLNGTFVELRSGVALAGAGSATVVRVKDGVQSSRADELTGHVFQGVGVSRVVIRDLLIDLNGANNLTPAGRLRNGHAIRFLNGGGDVRIENVTVLNNPGHNDIAANGPGRGLVVAGCTLRNGGHYVTGPENVHNTDFSFVYSEWSDTSVEGNLIEQAAPDVALQGYSGGIELHGSDSRAVRNVLRGCDPAVWIASAPAAIARVVVADNRMERCLRGVAFWNALPMSDVTVERNTIDVYRTPTSPSEVAVGIHQPNGGTAVFDAANANAAAIERLRILGNVVTCSLPAGSTLVARGIELHGVVNGTISGNRIAGMTDVGILLLRSPWGLTNLAIDGNEIVDSGRSPALGPERRAAILVNVAGSPGTNPVP